ncbi:MAG: arginine--tRNA ligase [Lentisphaerae bacterium]|jgi:arginyl-tRNA synthetase|nr:arginine--tRNA ligase [Lentisphaerota bacterium]
MNSYVPESLPPCSVIEDFLSDWFRKCFAKTFPDVDLAGAGSVAVATNPDFGDFQCNDAMPLAKTLKMPPRKIAEQIVSNASLPGVIESLEVAGPGFINIKLDDTFISGRAVSIGNDEQSCIPQCGAGKTVVIDYSSPNVAKPMHIGHIRSTVIGAALDNLYRALGFNVVADNHIGDWGTQFGIIIMGYRHFIDHEKLEESPAAELERVYVKSYAKAGEDESWMDKCRAELVKLQNGDAENLALWKEFIRLSRIEFDKTYERLGVSFDITRGESYYQDALAGIVERLKDNGLARKSEGAIIVDLSDEDQGVCIVQKSDGAFNYATTDIATVDSRVTEFSPARIIYVTDERQQLHFKQFFNICRKAGIAPETTELEHVWFGLMRLPEGTFSTRQGNVIKLESLLDEAEVRALAIIKDSRPNMPEEEAKELSKHIGIGAIKYADLSQDPRTLITFTWDKALSLDGNSGPYLQYAYARICSVMAKYKEQFPETEPSDYPLILGDELERAIALKLALFPGTVRKAALTYRPCVLADYLFDLAQAYSSFYQRVPFLKAEEGIRESRIRLCGIVAGVLSKGLSLLGINTPERI